MKASAEGLSLHGCVTLFISCAHSFFTAFYVDYYVRHAFPSISGRTPPDGLGRAVLYFAMGQIVRIFIVGACQLGVAWRIETHYTLFTGGYAGRLNVGGPLLALCFYLLWCGLYLPVLHAALSFALVVSAYEVTYLYCETSQRALQADAIAQSGDAEREFRLTSVFQGLGTVGLGFAAYFLDNVGKPLQLTWFCCSAFMTALLCGVGLWACATFLVRVAPSSSLLMLSGLHTRSATKYSSSGSTERLMSSYRFWSFIRQTIARPSAKALVLVAASQSFLGALLTSFFTILLSVVCSGIVSAPVRAALLALSFFLPSCLALVSGPLYGLWGHKRFLAGLLVCQALVGLVMLFVSRRMVEDEGFRPQSAFFSLLLLAARVLCETHRLLQSLIVDCVVDEDTVIFGRSTPMTAATEGLVSMVVTPMQALAPTLVCIVFFFQDALIPAHVKRGDAAKLKARTEAATARTAVVAGKAQQELIAAAVVVAPSAVMFVGAVTLALSISALGIWLRLYKLDGKHLQFVRMAMAKREEEKYVEAV